MRPPPAAAPPEEIEDEDDEDYLDEETTKPVAKASGKRTISSEADSDDTGKKKKLSRAEAFNTVSVTGNADDIPSGRYEAIIRNVTLQLPDVKGQSVRWNFELCNLELGDSNKVVTWNKLFYDDNSPCVPGIQIMKQSLAKIGYTNIEIDPEDDDLQGLQKVFEEITDADEKVGVILEITYNKGNDGRSWQRLRIDSACDNDVVQEYRDTIKY